MIISKHFKTAAMAIFVIGLSSCSRDWLENYTEDPARPIEVSPQVLLPSAQISYAMAQGDAIPRLSSIFLQQMTGTDRQSLAHNRYAQIGESDFDNIWGGNGYAGGMMDLNIIIDKTRDASPHYAGTAKIMMAMYLGLFTDTWGDIPFSEAFQGGNNLNPRYESQEAIYNHIFRLLDEGIAGVSAASSNLTPGSEDLIFKGDMVKWGRFAHSLKARYLNHLSKKAALYNPAEILSALADGFAGNEDQAEIVFAGAPNTNPWYQFNSQREGYITQFGFMYDDIMIPNNDPRVPFYRSQDSINMPFYGSQTSPLYLMSYAEHKFIEAEVLARQGGNSSAALEEAVSANMNVIGVNPTDRDAYIANLPSSPSLEDVMTEKYLALFSHVEAWTDWRRTGFPSGLAVFPGAQLPEIPRRLPYPETERLYNDNFINLTGSDGFLKRLWWDE
jgi:hypothetical protein